MPLRYLAEVGFSRFPVADESGDLVGNLHIKVVLETDPAKRTRPLAGKWIRALASVRASDRLHDALRIMQDRGAHMARVVRDDGSLVGEIRDAAQHARRT